MSLRLNNLSGFGARQVAAAGVTWDFESNLAQYADQAAATADGYNFASGWRFNSTNKSLEKWLTNFGNAVWWDFPSALTGSYEFQLDMSFTVDTGGLYGNFVGGSWNPSTTWYDADLVSGQHTFTHSLSSDTSVRWSASDNAMLCEITDWRYRAL